MIQLSIAKQLFHQLDLTNTLASVKARPGGNAPRANHGECLCTRVQTTAPGTRSPVIETCLDGDNGLGMGQVVDARTAVLGAQYMGGRSCHGGSVAVHQLVVYSPPWVAQAKVVEPRVGRWQQAICSPGSEV